MTSQPVDQSLELSDEDLDKLYCKVFRYDPDLHARASESCKKFAREAIAADRSLRHHSDLLSLTCEVSEQPVRFPPDYCCYSCLCEEAKSTNNPLLTSLFMVVCQKCGNKRCPHAKDHQLECTDSNEPSYTLTPNTRQ